MDEIYQELYDRLYDERYSDEEWRLADEPDTPIEVEITDREKAALWEEAREIYEDSEELRKNPHAYYGVSPNDF